jgi:hypothetical protein
MLPLSGIEAAFPRAWGICSLLFLVLVISEIYKTSSSVEPSVLTE